MTGYQTAWSRALLVEGTSGVGKSTLIDRLLRQFVSRQPPRRLRTLLHLTQAHTYGPLVPSEDLGALTVEQNLAHLDQVGSILKWHITSLRAESQVKFHGIVDTLHFTQCFRPGVLAWENVAPLDLQLASLGVRLLFLRASPGSIWTRGIDARRNEQFINSYACPRFGVNLHQIHDYFVAEQERMGALLSRTSLPYLELDADRDLEGNVEAAYAFWQSAAASSNLSGLPIRQAPY
jgi:hypothetical protein